MSGVRGKGFTSMSSGRGAPILRPGASALRGRSVSIGRGISDGRSARSNGAQRRERDDNVELANLRAINAHLMRELSALKQRERETQRLAERDGLTGLYNRRCLSELLGTALADAAEHQQRVGLLFIDLNGFKGINDEHGHAAGDKVLTTVAGRISAKVRTGDIVCRYGGDEFVVVLPHVPDAAAVSRVAEMIRDRVSMPLWIKGHEQHLTAAIGESIYPGDGETAEALLQHADKAMYGLKTRSAKPLAATLNAASKRPSRRRNDR